MKKQVRTVKILMLCNFVIIALLSTLFIVQNLGAYTIAQPPRQYQRIRDAFVQQHENSDIVWSQNIGGSLDEYVVDAFVQNNGNIIIFGNSTSGDLDIDAPGGFVAVLNNEGRTQSFMHLSGMRLIQITPTNNGYILLKDDGFDGNTISVSHYNSNIVSTIFTINNSTAIEALTITHQNVLIYQQNTIGGPHLFAMQLDRYFDIAGPQTRVQHAPGLIFIKAQHAGNTLLLFATEGSGQNLVVIVINAIGTNPNIRVVQNGNSYKVLQIQPSSQGLIVPVTITSGSQVDQMQIWRLNISEILDTNIPLSPMNTLSPRWFGINHIDFVTTRSHFLMLSHSGQGGNIHIFDDNVIDGALTPIQGFNSWNNINSNYILDYINERHLLTGSTNRGFGITEIYGDSVVSNRVFGGLSNNNESAPIILRHNNTTTIVLNTKSASNTSRDGDVIQNFGGQDIWIVRL